MSLWFAPLLFVTACSTTGAAQDIVHSLHITILSTMLADRQELGEWGFSAIVEADGHRILFDTGAHPDVVQKNCQSMGIDLASVPEVVLSHNHLDHVGGLVTLRQSVLPRAPHALAQVHVATGIFFRRAELSRGIDTNELNIFRPEYERTGGVFIQHDGPVELYPGVWLTGPIPRKYPERNWGTSGEILTPAGWTKDNIPEDQAMVFNTKDGLVVLFGCAHAGMINTLTYARAVVRPARIHAIIGGVHLFQASDATLEWTAKMLGTFGVDNFLGAHCTGLETVYRFRVALHLDRQHAVVAAVGSSYDLARGIDPLNIAR